VLTVNIIKVLTTIKECFRHSLVLACSTWHQESPSYANFIFVRQERWWDKNHWDRGFMDS
jgi:hypothetical protein